MTRSLLAFWMLFILSPAMTVYSQVGQGSEITYRATNTPGIAEVTLVIYRACDDLTVCAGGCGTACSKTINIMGADSGYTSSSFGSVVLTLQNVRDISNNVNGCSDSKNKCNNMGCTSPGVYSFGFERYEFKGFINTATGFPAGCCKIRLTFEMCCLYGFNTIAGSTANHYTEAILNRCFLSGITNSSPQFTNDPLFITCGGENVLYNNGLTDPDNDSLSISLVPIISAYNTSANYTPPFTYDYPIPWTGSAGSFPPPVVCDILNGDFTIRPGNSSANDFYGMIGFKCEEWRKINGVYKLLGSVRRQNALGVIANCQPNNSPRFITNPPLQINPYAPKTYFDIMSGTQLCFSITAKDTDWYAPVRSDTTSLTWNQSLVSYGATFLPAYSGVRSINGPREDIYNFCWTPNDSLASGIFYPFTVKAGDNRCPNNGKASKSFLVRVVGNPHVSVFQKKVNCKTVTLAFSQAVSQPVNLSFIAWEISNIANDKSFTNTTVIPNTPNTSITHTFAGSGKYYIRLVSYYQYSGYKAQNVLDSVEILPSDLTDSAHVTPIACNGDYNGEVFISGKYGNPPYLYKHYSDSVFSTRNQFTNLAGGRHFFTVKDAAGCLFTDTITVHEPASLRDTVVHVTNVSCPGKNDGSIIFEATGGIKPYRYSIDSNNFVSVPQFTNLASSGYTIHIRDNHNCYASFSLVVAADSMRLTTSITDQRCFDSMDGEVSIKTTGGKAPYMYRLNTSTFVNDSLFRNLSAGSYQVVVKDSKLCETSAEVFISKPAQLTLEASMTPVSCFGNADGSVLLAAGGGIAPYKYSSENTPYSSNPYFTNLMANPYSFNVIDQNGCKGIVSVSVNQPAKLSASFIKTNPCNGMQDGSIDVIASGGTPPYLYSINNREFSLISFFPGLSAQTYALLIKDSSGCLAQSSETLIDPPVVSLDNISGNLVVPLHSVHNYSVAPKTGVLYNWTITKGTFVGRIDTSSVLVRWDTAGLGFIMATAYEPSGCADSLTMMVSIGSMGIDEVAENMGLNLYPNPVKEKLYISVKKIPVNSYIFLYDLTGKQLYQQSLRYYQEINMDSLRPGMYLLRIGNWSGKLLKN